MNGVPFPTKKPNPKRDRVWARLQARACGTQQAEQRNPAYWLAWLGSCREAGLGQTAMKRLLQIHHQPLSDASAVDFIAELLTEECWHFELLDVIAATVRSTGRTVEEVAA